MADKLHLMLDIETTGKRVGCRVLTVGAIAFDRGGLRMETFYERIHRDLWDRETYHDDQSTMEWWAGQSDAAREEAFGGNLEPYEAAVLWKGFVKALNPDFIWCKGASFDFPIWGRVLDGAGVGMDVGLPYKTLRCMRGLAALSGIDGDGPMKGVAHNALDDARHQALVVHQALTKLKAWERL